MVASDRGGPSSRVQTLGTACHAGGRGFESRRSRPSKPLLTRGFVVPASLCRNRHGDPEHSSWWPLRAPTASWSATLSATPASSPSAWGGTRGRAAALTPEERGSGDARRGAYSPARSTRSPSGAWRT